MKGVLYEKAFLVEGEMGTMEGSDAKSNRAGRSGANVRAAGQTCPRV